MQTSTIVKIDKVAYELPYPNVGQKLEIENYKLAYSLGTYGELARSNHNTAKEMLNLIDAVSYFRTLSEDILKKYNLKEYSKIDFATSLKLQKAFAQYAKWYKEFETELYKNLEEDDDTTEDIGSSESLPEQTV